MMRATSFGAACALTVLMTLAPAGTATTSVASSVRSAPRVASPVADAAMRGDLEAVTRMLRDGADVNAAQGDGMTALHWAALRGDGATMEVLIYAGALLDPTTRLGGYTPLHLASRDARAEAVERLLRAGADATAVTGTGAQALHLAAAAGSREAIRSLIEHGVGIDAPDTRAGRTALMFATAADRRAVIDLLLAAGADVGIATRVVDYPELERADLVERRRRARVLEAAKEPRPEDEDESRTPGAPPEAQAAAAATPAGAAPTGGAGQPPPDPDDPDPAAAAADPAAAVRDPDDPDPDDPDPDEPDPDEPDEPLSPDPDNPTQAASPDPDQPTAPERRPLSYTDLVGTQGGMTALHYAARDGRAAIVERLLAAGAELDRRTGGDDSTPLLIAIINGHYDLAMDLLARGADPNAVSEDGAGPLFATINHEWALRTWYPQPTASQRQQTTYLELMEALLAAGADPDARVDTHIWYAAYNAGRMGVDFAGATPFWRAAYATDVAAMRLLSAYGADPDIPTVKPASRRFPGFPGAGSSSQEDEEDPSGLPPVPVGGPAVHPLHAASGVGYGTSRIGQQHRHVPDGWLPAVRYLVDELGVDVNVRDHDGYTALHNAAARGDDDTIRFLVSRGADVTFVSRRGQTTVDMANGPQQRVQPFPETIALLEGYGAENSNNCQSCD